MGTYVNGVYLPTLAETGWDDEVNDALRQLGEASVNVRAAPYGAVGDGITDDTNAIQAAIDGTGWPSSAGVVLIPPGTYKTDGTITLDGGGATSTPALRILGHGARLTTQVQSADPLIDITNSAVSATYIGIHGLMFLPNASGSPYRTGLRLTNAQDTLVHGCTFAGNFGTGISFAAGINNYNKIDSCSFYYLRRGIEFGTTSDYSAVTNCAFGESVTGAPLNWIDANNPSSPTGHIRLTGNTFYSPGATLAAVRVNNGDGWSITGNVFRSSEVESIRIGGNGSATGHSITSNIFSGGKQHDIYVNGGQRNVISGNSFLQRAGGVTANTYSAVRILNTFGGDAGHHNVVMGNNSRDTASALNFMVELDAGCDYCTIVGNIGAAGFQAAGANNQLSANITH